MASGSDARDDWDRNLEAVRSAAERADFVIYYQHFQITNEDLSGDRSSRVQGHLEVDDVQEWQSRFAKAIIDAGAGMFIAHGDRIFDGVEIYQGSPIIRQFGGFAYQGLQAEGSYDPLVWEGLLGVLTIRAGRVSAMEVLPLRLDEGREDEYGGEVEFRQKRGFSDLAAGEQGRRIPRAIRRTLPKLRHERAARKRARADRGLVTSRAGRKRRRRARTCQTHACQTHA